MYHIIHLRKMIVLVIYNVTIPIFIQLNLSKNRLFGLEQWNKGSLRYRNSDQVLMLWEGECNLRSTYLDSKKRNQRNVSMTFPTPTLWNYLLPEKKKRKIKSFLHLLLQLFPYLMATIQISNKHRYQYTKFIH